MGICPSKTIDRSYVRADARADVGAAANGSYVGIISHTSASGDTVSDDPHYYPNSLPFLSKTLDWQSSVPSELSNLPLNYFVKSVSQCYLYRSSLQTIKIIIL